MKEVLPINIRRIMRKYGIKPDKRLGQHFLIDSEPLYAMIEAAELTKADGVLEVGPGLGVLTKELCREVKKVVAVEKDRTLIPILEDETKQFENICIIEDDVLKLDIEKLTDHYFDTGFKVVANLPYYITSPIIMKLIENRFFISLAVLMIQKEVAQRLIATPGKKDYGILSIAVQLYADVDMVYTIGQEAFLPPPKVESAIVKIRLRREARVVLKDEGLFFKVVEAAFGERRKTLRNSLKRRLTLPGITPDIIDKVLQEAHIDPMRRGETLSIQEFADITHSILNYIK